MPVKTHVAAPTSTNSRRLTAKPAREELAVICACTGFVGTGLGAVYVECGGQTCPKKLLTHTNRESNSRHPALVRMQSDMRLFGAFKNQEKKFRAARVVRFIISVLDCFYQQ